MLSLVKQFFIDFGEFWFFTQGWLLFNIHPKLLEISFFRSVVCDQGRGVGTQVFGRGWYSTETKSSNFWVRRGGVTPLLVRHPDLFVRKTPWKKLGLLTVMICEWVGLFSFKTINLQHAKLKIEKRWQILWWCSIHWRLFIHFKARTV